jgi:hypothetical protein
MLAPTRRRRKADIDNDLPLLEVSATSLIETQTTSIKSKDQGHKRKTRHDREELTLLAEYNGTTATPCLGSTTRVKLGEHFPHSQKWAT